MGNIKLVKSELAKSIKTHFIREMVPRGLEFLRKEMNIVFDNYIGNYKNDNTVQPQRYYRKGKNPNSTQRAR